MNFKYYRCMKLFENTYTKCLIIKENAWKKLVEN